MTMPINTTCLFLTVCLFTGVYCKNVSGIVSCKDMFEKGVEAYLNNKFHDCVLYIEEALDMYHEYNKKVQNCRLECHKKAELSEPLYYINVENLRFYEKIIRNTLCIIECRNKDRHLFEEYNLDEDAARNFEKRKPYEYLHICYFQIKDLQKASSAAFTYLVENPTDEAVINNLKYYSKLPGVSMEDIINYEAKDYVYLYVRGASAYEAKQWKEVIQYMEESLVSYLQSEDECRAQCEGPYDQGWFPDFIPSVANHFTSCLRCKRKCKNSLNNLNGEKHADLFESHYHYLQFAYFKVGNLRAACESVSSYLLFNPLDETMLYNIDYYKKMPKIQTDFFQPRQEALHYFHRNKYEEDLMLFVKDAFSKDIAIHTIDESPFDLRPNKLEQLVTFKVLDFAVLDTVLQTVQFHVNSKLHFTFTHLVCRTTVKDYQINRTDLSHGIHADNCNIQEDNSCLKKPPAFIWRDYTAILYLNRNIFGAKLFFSADPQGIKIEEIIEPTCGRVVSVTSGKENLHGVRAVKNGARCALAIWFTHDKKYYEREQERYE